MDANHSCRCCLRCPPAMDLATPYTHLGKTLKTVIYSDMLRECFDIHLTKFGVSHGICMTCVGRLQDASDFKLQVQRCQAELGSLLAEVEPKVKVELSDHGTCADSIFDDFYENTLFKSESQENMKNDDLVEEDVPLPVSKLTTTCHTMKRPFTCEECNSPIYTNNLFKCHKCDKNSVQKNNVKIEQKIHTDGNLYLCSECGFKCKRRAGLRRHQMSHTGEKPYSCKSCDYKCSTRTLLKRHEKRHTGNKNYECSHCDYKSIDKCHLKRHLKLHTGEKPFKCHLCNYSCREKEHLRNHLTLHTGEKLNKCSHCGFKCTRKSDLKVHQTIHTGEKPYKCNHCDYACRQKHSLVVHLKSKHAGENQI